MAARMKKLRPRQVAKSEEISRQVGEGAGFAPSCLASKPGSLISGADEGLCRDASRQGRSQGQTHAHQPAPSPPSLLASAGVPRNDPESAKETHSGFVAAGSVNRAGGLEEYKSPNTGDHSQHRALSRSGRRGY